MRGLPFYVDERVIVPRSFIGELLDVAFRRPDDATALADRRSRRGRERARSLHRLRLPRDPRQPRIFPMRRSMRSICRRTRWRSRRATSPIISSAIASRCIRATCSRRSRDTRYDLIITNPPYVDAEGMAELPAECRAEPEMAFDGGDDGLDIVRRILDEAQAASAAARRPAVRNRPRPRRDRSTPSRICRCCGSTPRIPKAKCSGSPLRICEARRRSLLPPSFRGARQRPAARASPDQIHDSAGGRDQLLPADVAGVMPGSRSARHAPE